MYEILEELNKTAGVTGSMIVGKDGIVIAADLDTQLQD
ncbi:MAG: roadblock/LC7 domain-containing protein, partial [Candidatus Zixiibacteriota bacterium]